MTATVIEQLVVTLGLDGSAYRTGSQQTMQQNKKLRDDASMTAKALSEHGKQGAEFFGQIAEKALQLFAIIAAGRGLEQLTTQAVQVGAATAQTARNIGTATKELSAWQNVMKQAGQSADEATNSLSNLSQQQQALLSGNIAGAPGLAMMQRIAHISALGPGNVPVDPGVIAQQFAAWAAKQTGPQAQYWGQRFGFTTGFITAAQTLGPAGIAAGLANDATVNAQQAAAMQALQTSFAGLQIAVDQTATDWTTKLEPAMLSLILATTAFVKLLNGKVSVKDFEAFFKSGGEFDKLTHGAMATPQPPGSHPGAKPSWDTGSVGGNLKNFGALLFGTPLGIRNNNPGNLRYVGQAGATADVNGFAVFPSMAAGQKALIDQIALDGARGKNTVAKLITKYEGGTDPNDTGMGNPDHNNIQAYISAVVGTMKRGGMNISADSPLNMSDPATAAALARAIAVQEGNGNVYNAPPGLPGSVETYITRLRNAQIYRGRAAQEGVTVHVGPVTVHTAATSPAATGRAVQSGVEAAARRMLVKQANGGLN